MRPSEPTASSNSPMIVAVSILVFILSEWTDLCFHRKIRTSKISSRESLSCMSPVWSQSYTLFGRGLAVSSAIACIPVVTLLFLLGVRRKPAWFAALWALLAAALVALFAYKLPPVLTVSSAAYGAGFGLFPISWIVFWAIMLYRVSVDTGKFEIIKSTMGNLTSDARLQALLIAFAFGAFVEGAAGFGTQVAVAAAMLVGL